MAKNKEILEDMKRQATHSVSKGASVVKVGGKKLTELDAQDLEKLDASQIEKAREAQLNTERAQKVRLRKQEAKRVDHLARALREEEIKRLEAYRVAVEKEDIAFFEQFKKEKAAEAQLKHSEKLALAQILRPYASNAEDWIEKKLERKREEIKEKRTELYKKNVEKAKQERIARAIENWRTNNYKIMTEEKNREKEAGMGRSSEDKPKAGVYRPPFKNRGD